MPTIAEIQGDFAAQLTRINDRRVRGGVPIPALEDPRDVLGAIEGLAKAARLSGREETLNKLGALCIAARLARARADVLDIASGDDAA